MFHICTTSPRGDGASRRLTLTGLRIGVLAATILAISCALAPTGTLAQGNSDDPGGPDNPGPPDDRKLPDAAKNALFKRNPEAVDLVNLLAITKDAKVVPFFDKNGTDWADNPNTGYSVQIKHLNDPSEDYIVVEAKIPKSELTVPPSQGTSPITIAPMVFVKIGNSTCGWTYSGSGGSETCRRICW